MEYPPLIFWFNENPFPIPRCVIIDDLNRYLREEYPETYNEGWRFIDLKARGLRCSVPFQEFDRTPEKELPRVNGLTDQIKLMQLDDNGKIILHFRPMSELIVTYK